jgi:hypothetical protein
LVLRYVRTLHPLTTVPGSLTAVLLCHDGSVASLSRMLLRDAETLPCLRTVDTSLTTVLLSDADTPACFVSVDVCLAIMDG